VRTGQATALDSQIEKAILEHGRRLLEGFHSAYEKDPIGRETEFRRGEVSTWRQLLGTIYGQRIAQDLTEKISEATRLTIPHCGLLADDGDGYLGFDSGCHMFIGKLPE
jgi:hypothetical protein